MCAHTHTQTLFPVGADFCSPKNVSPINEVVKGQCGIISTHKRTLSLSLSFFLSFSLVHTHTQYTHNLLPIGADLIRPKNCDNNKRSGEEVVRDHFPAKIHLPPKLFPLFQNDFVEEGIIGEFKLFVVDDDAQRAVLK